MDYFAPVLEIGVNRMLMLETTGIYTFFNGLESFIPNDRYYLGAAPELDGYQVASGYDSIVIIFLDGTGIALAQ